MGDVMLGTIILWPLRWVPVGWHVCDGSLLSIQNYAALYSLIGTVYGGNGSTTFGLPDLRNRVPVGAPSTSSVNGQGFGSSAVPVTIASSGLIQPANLPQHSHTATFTPTTGPVNFTIAATTGNQTVSTTVNATTSSTSIASSPAPGASMLSNTASVAAKIYGPTQTTNLVPLTGVSSTLAGTPSTPALSGTVNAVNGGTVAVAPYGPGTPTAFTVTGQASVNVTQPSLYTNFIIAIEGIYPQRA
ncbi:phage tail protein [Azospirillum rugosum]|uniref:Microcystin-dependent protein n=1 Tax=Azospirillum rugosum TaxID=416170 RepID=A0ABS4SG50_9PROT|nr:tail fiber protein [Azospirillum rugosum]MBP2291541.1 microcystin-dependent protein [Azospirillum rugosum]MDQ0525330.1 microcystin-dependent protein [Azospirillum rugosum]